MSKQTNPNLSHLNIAEYLYNKSVRNITPAIIDCNGVAVHLFGGEEIPSEKFEAMYPLTLVSSNPKGLNADTTHIK